MDYLTHALGNYDLSVKLLHKLRTSYQEFDSKLRVTESRRVIFQRAMEAAYRLYVRTGKEEYKEKAFEFAEKGRAIVLLSTLKEKQAMAYGGVPDSLIQKEGRLVRGIESHINLISEEQQQKPPRARVVNELEKKLFLLKSEQHDLITLFEKQYPNYYSLKYDDRVLSTASVQKRMDPGMALVEYMITADKIYAFILTRERFDIIPVDKPAGFKEKVAELENYLQDVTFFGQSRETYSKFLESSHSLYQILVEPFMSLLAGKDLVVITDEEISGIPFEVLLTQPANVNMEFGTLPYFIKQQAIGYAYSVNLMFFSPRRSIPDQLKLAAFSPAYDGQQVRGSRDGLVLKPLKYAIEEARAVCGYFSGKLYKGRKATEDVFKQVASRYDVLHLAMHAHMDDENPMHSKLAFTPAEGGAEDGMLNTYELFNLKLKARMAVLSACNTGVGKFQKGEGVMSIARGFYYAGCPDVVMTLWPVEDQMSTQLITDFYAYLNEGQNKIDALRQAKLNLIKISDPLRSHPYFWAAYVNIGDISPLVSDKSRKPRILLWTVVASLVLLVAVPLLGRRWRRKA